MALDKTPKDKDTQEELEREWDINSDASPESSPEGEEALHGSFEKKEIEEIETDSKKNDKKETKKKKGEKGKHGRKKKTATETEATHSIDAEKSMEVEGEKVDTNEHELVDTGKETQEIEEPKRGEAIATQLAQIYENSDGSMPDMKTFESSKGSRFVRALIIFLVSCLFFAGAAWVGLFVLQPRSHFSETDVSLTISGEEEVAPGAEATYRIRYANAQSVALQEAALEVRYPEGFKVTSVSKPGDTEANNKWSLGTLDPGSSGYIDVTGKYFGDSGSEQSIRVFLSYKPQNFSSTFQAVATETIQTKSDSATLDIDIPEEVSRGSNTPITVTITPLPDLALEHVRVNCVTPEFTQSGASTPEADKDTPCQWSFEKITEKTVIQFSGAFATDAASKDFGIEVRGWDGEDRSGDGFLIAKASKSTTLVDSTTNINLVINGGSGDMNISPGETISASIVVQNKGDVPLEDVVVEAVIDGPSYSNRSILGWQDLKVTGDAAVKGEQLAPDTRRGKIIWDKQYVPELASIAPGKEVKVDVSIPIRSGDQITLANFTTNKIVFGTNFSYGKENERKTISSNQINLTLVSDFALKIDHEFTGTSGTAGTYAISWTLSNSFHGLKNIELVADFYGDVEVDQSKFEASAGELIYDSESERITWKIPEMPSSVDVLNSNFEIVLKVDNPTQKELMSKVRMSADDETVNATLKKVGEGISIR